MYVYVSGRRMGKTHTVVRWFLEDPEHSVIVVFDERRKLHIWQQIQHHLITPPPHWLENIVVGLFGNYYARGKSWRRVAIDDLDSFLESFVHIKPDLVTITGTAIGPLLEMREKPTWATARPQQHPTVHGIRPHKYPRTPEEAEKMKTLASETEITGEAAEKFGLFDNPEAPSNSGS